MSSDGSDIEIQSTLPKTSNKKMPKSPSEDLLKKKQEKKHTTKIMINQALIDLKSRKGVSLYAIKKYLTEKFNVDTEKMGYHIKKYIKSAVEDGTIIQTKGLGASGSFKLVPVKEKKPKPKKMTKDKSEKAKDPEKKKKLKEKSKKSGEKTVKSKKTKAKDSSIEGKDKLEKPKKKMDKDKERKEKVPKEKVPKEKMPKDKKVGEEKVKKVRIAKKDMQTPAKKKVMMKRKSIGSIIKPPRMKPGKA